MAKKRTKRRTHFFLPKSAIFLVKSAHFLTPQTIFIAFLCINFFQISNFALFFLFSIAFFYIFLNKGLFCCFIKAHKNFSRRHQPFKGAPMCAKAHMFRNSDKMCGQMVNCQYPQSGTKYPHQHFSIMQFWKMTPLTFFIAFLCNNFLGEIWHFGKKF